MTDDDGARIPPHNRDAENALLSACLLYTDRRTEALERIAPDDFYAPANRRVYAAIQRLHHQHRPVDVITVAAEVQTGDPATNINPEHVAGYLNSLGSALNTGEYCRIVADMAHYRRLLHAARDLTEAVYAFDDTAIDQAAKTIAQETT